MPTRVVHADVDADVIHPPPRIEITDTARISGDISLLRGDVEVMGKRFEIERGLVRLRPEGCQMCKPSAES